MSDDGPFLDVRQSGPRTVVGFRGRDILDLHFVNDCRDELYTLIRQHECKVLAFDLTGVRFLGSTLLGLLVSLRAKPGVEIEVINPSEEVRDVLSVTRLDELIHISTDEASS